MGVSTELRVKSSLKNDLRRFSLPLPCRFSTLEGTIRKLYALEGKSVVLKYVDDEEDLVTVTCDAEFEEVIHCAQAMGGMVRLHVSCPEGGSFFPRAWAASGTQDTNEEKEEEEEEEEGGGGEEEAKGREGEQKPDEGAPKENGQVKLADFGKEQCRKTCHDSEEAANATFKCSREAATTTVALLLETLKEFKINQEDTWASSSSSSAEWVATGAIDRASLNRIQNELSAQVSSDSDALCKQTRSQCDVASSEVSISCAVPESLFAESERISGMTVDACNAAAASIAKELLSL